MSIYYLDLTTTDPDFNLAMEQYVFDRLPRDHSYFMLWQNDRAIIVGRYQNTAAEINAPYVEQHGIRVVRRLSGGGAVYHDMGNLNYTYIGDAKQIEKLDFALFCQPVIKTLADLGVKAELNGRNDMTIDGRKFSGNAQYRRQGRVMHHGTILFDSDLSVVANALQVDPTKFQTKGIQSTRSRVTNVREHLPQDIGLSEFRHLLLQNAAAGNAAEPYPLSQADLEAVEKLRRERYGTWAWNFGESPAYTQLNRRRFDGCGLVELFLDVDKGILRGMTLRGDFFHIADPAELAAHFIGIQADRESYKKVLETVDVSHYISGLDNERFLELLCE